jgi:chemotaxis protein methyltransferase CheR
MLMLDGDRRIITASRAFCTMFHISEAETVGRQLRELGDGQWDLPELTALLDNVIPGSRTIEDYHVTLNFPGIGKRTVLLNARKIYREGNNPIALLLAMEDITERDGLQAERDRSLEQTNPLLEELNH